MNWFQKLIYGTGLWNIYLWLVCDCRKSPFDMSWHGDGKGGWLCDVCGRPERRQAALSDDLSSQVGADGGGHQIEPKQPLSEDNGNWDSRGNA
jgi:hypothetical protein